MRITQRIAQWLMRVVKWLDKRASPSVRAYSKVPERYKLVAASENDGEDSEDSWRRMLEHTKQIVDSGNGLRADYSVRDEKNPNGVVVKA